MSSKNTAHFILIHPDDNVLICCKNAKKGEVVIIEGASYILSESIQMGHKIARFCLSAGDNIIRYGHVIGSVQTDVKIGEHVHMHNLKSHYISSHDRRNADENEIRS